MKKRKRKIKNKNRLMIIGAIIVIVALLAVLTIKLFDLGKATRASSEEVRYVPLDQEEINAVASTVLSSEFIQDVPEKDPIALNFYSFDDQGTYWRDGFLIGNNGFLSEGEPSVYIALHSKYIEKLKTGDLCSVIQEAIGNGELNFDSEYGNARLLLKYGGMLKHRNCFGF